MPTVTLPFWETLIRLLVAVTCGGIIGIERGKKRRPAGFRTHMIVCIGAALTMILSTYLTAMISNVWHIDSTTDVSRFGAQVINGIGLLGAGTIIITGHQQIKGLTTAAGLWASACMGLAIGAGFYVGALVGCLLILITIVAFSKLESFILSHSRNINMFVVFESIDSVTHILAKLKEHDVKVFDVEITKQKNSGTSYPNAIFSIKIPKKKSHATIMAAIAQVDTVRSIEEL
jgi:putative Mg2+ transporter-C (MgtC) family protein